MTTNPSHAFQPPCAICNTPAATIDLSQQNGRFHLTYTGPGGSNDTGKGPGDPISAERAQAIIAAFTPPYDQAIIRTADFYDDAGYCLNCQKFYCSSHWNISSTGGGTCPQGHFKSLDPHWSPDSDDR
jgi:hypothetical protein